MLNELSHYIIFLHGLSGSGKGVIKQILVEKYEALGYEVYYGSSGDLFRAALNDPVLAEQVNQGIFLHTLGAILPGLERIYEEFVSQWLQSNYKRILILDGFIRRTTFTSGEGELIPSQLEQISVTLDRALQSLPNSKVLQDSGSENRLSQIMDTLRKATHIITSIDPLDAEAQMVSRSQSTLDAILQQLKQKVSEGSIKAEIAETVENHLGKLEAILQGGVKFDDAGNVTWLPRDEWGNKTPPAHYQFAVNLVKEIRKAMAADLNLSSTATLAQIFDSIEIKTELREDDIPDLGRKKRIENYIANYITELSVQDGIQRDCEPGFASLALTQDFDFVFHVDGSFSSKSDNCIVIANGKSKGIGLKEFETEVTKIADSLSLKTETARKRLQDKS